MDNEKYGIELELITNKFKEKIEQVKSAFRGLTDKKINVNANTAQIEYLKQQIKEISALLDYNSKKPFMDYNEVLKNRAQLEKLTNQYNKLIAKQNEVSSASNKANLGISKSLDRMTSKIKRFGLSLLSIRSIWSLVSRASSAYLAQDTELSNKLQSAWVGLGAMLAPIIERIVDLIAKSVKYINIFIKALTGVDLLAKATSKSMAGTAKSAKALNKALAGFDELQNLDIQAGGGDTGLGAGLGGLEDVKIDTEWAEKIKAFGEWIKQEWPTVVGLIAGLFTTLKIAPQLIEQLGLKVGGLKALKIGAAITGVVYAISNLIKYLNDPSFKNFGGIIQGIGLAIVSVFGAIPGIVVIAVGTILKYWENIKSFFQNGINWLKDKSKWIHDIFGKDLGSVYDFFVKILQNGLNFFDKMVKSVKGQFDGIIEFLQGVFTGNWNKAWNGIKKGFTAWWNGIKGMFKTGTIDMGKAVGELISNSLKAVVNKMLQRVENILNNPIRAINSLINIVNSFPGVNMQRLSTFRLPRLATGTNYVPEDQLAYIHKGEAVVPKKFNSREYFGGTNDETNALLEELIQAVGNIEINPYTTIKDVGKASLSYINNKSRQLGESVVV